MKNKKDNKIEYVYVLTNPAMPEYVKVGRTNNIERRIKDLSKDTSVPRHSFGFLRPAFQWNPGGKHRPPFLSPYPVKYASCRNLENRFDFRGGMDYIVL